MNLRHSLSHIARLALATVLLAPCALRADVASAVSGPTVLDIRTDLPKTLADNALTTSSLTVVGYAGVIADLNVRLDLAHPRVGDLTLRLVSPHGTRMLLVDRAGGTGANFTSTLFDDEAADPIASATAPFTGSFQPAEPLAALTGQNPNGPWTLEVIDQASGDTGTLTGWVLLLDILLVPELVVESPPGQELETGGPGLDFGGVAVGASSAPASMTIRNTGSAELTGISLSLTGPDAGAFQLEASAVSDVLAVGESAVCTVTFRPTNSGGSSGLLQIASNDADENPFEIQLTGWSPATNDGFTERADLGNLAGLTADGTLVESSSQLASGEPDLSQFAAMGFVQDRTVWYGWTAPAGVEWARIDVAGPNIPTVISVYTGGDLATLDQICLNRRELITLPNRLTFPVVPGTTYAIRVAAHAMDVEGYEWSWPPPTEPIDLDFELGLAAIGTPTAAEEFVLRGRGWMATGETADLPAAEADFTAALGLDASHQEARFLRALTRLLRLEIDTATDTLLTQLGVTRTGSLRSDGTLTMPEDADGDPIPAAGARSSMAIDWLTGTVMPRLAQVRGDLHMITDDAFRSDLTQSELIGVDVYVDKGDVLVLKAVTHGLEMVFNLVFTYDLEVSLESLYLMNENGELSAEQVLTTFTNLLEFATSDRRNGFAEAMRAMEQDYAEALEFIQNRRGDPSDLVTENLSHDPQGATDLHDALTSAVMSLDGVVDYQGTRVDLSRLLASGVSARGFMPEFSDGFVRPGSLPDPTFDGILPDATTSDADNVLYELGMMWGMGQYAAEFGNFLKMMGMPSGPREDGDGDGTDNFSEWLNFPVSDPTVTDVIWQNFTHQLIAPGQREVRISFVRRKDLLDWRTVVSVSDDLLSWDTTEVQVEMVGTPADNGDGFTETVTYRLTDTAAAAESKYLRIEAVPK